MYDIHIKRVYDTPADADGYRVLIDRLWPRGVSKQAARIDHWARSIAPSDALRQWYRHDPEKWPEFQTRYFAELDAKPAEIDDLQARLRGRRVTFVFASKETRLNNAAALKAYILARAG